MYFFLCHLSFLDFCYSTDTVPQLLIHLQGHDQTISYGGCVAQFFLVLALSSTESMLLVVMAFDRNAAVCSPLHCMTILNPHLCFSLAIASWSGVLVKSLIQTDLIMAIPLCGNHLNHL
jgi:olfactory receptor